MVGGEETKEDKAQEPQEKPKEAPKEEHKPEPKPLTKRSLKATLNNLYEHHYKQLMLVSIAIVVIALVIIGAGYARTGEILPRGVSLKGGITLTLFKTGINIDELRGTLRLSFPQGDINVISSLEAGSQKAVIIEASDVTVGDLEAKLAEIFPGLTKDEYTLEEIGPALGTSFFIQAMYAILIAFVLMAIVVFITFRDIVPSSFVILCAVCDMLCTLAVLVVFNVKLSTAGIAALLMLVGFSVDTDILLTTRVLKRKEHSVYERTVDAMKTGVTMSAASFVATFIAFLFTHSEVLRQIMMILWIGLVFDIITTWLLNAGILRWHMEHLAKKGKHV